MSLNMYTACEISRGYGPIPQDEGFGYPRSEDHEYCSIQVDLTDDVEAAVVRFGHTIPGELLADKGVETSPHVTLKYGLDPIENDQLEACFMGVDGIDMTFGSTSLFVKPEKYDVLKCDVASSDLRSLHAKIIKMFPHVDLHEGYQPHVTIAYLKPGMGARFIGQSPLSGMSYRASNVSYCDYSGNRNVFRLGGPIRVSDDKPPAPLSIEEMGDGPAQMSIADAMKKKKKKHRGFKEVQKEISQREGVSKNSAGAILAAASRKASPAAKAKNPALKKVKMSAPEPLNILQASLKMSAVGGLPDVGGAVFDSKPAK